MCYCVSDKVEEGSEYEQEMAGEGKLLNMESKGCPGIAETCRRSSLSLRTQIVCYVPVCMRSWMTTWGLSGNKPP